MKNYILKAFALLMAGAILLTTSGCSGDAAQEPVEEGSLTNGTVTAVEEQKPEAMRNITSMELVKEMTFGWNLGNTLDACQADRNGDGKIDEHAEEGEKPDETLWGNPKATKELFSALKKDGVTAVRIPITWRDHMDEEGNVDPEWMDRVQEVVDYAYGEGMYVIINVHHDGGGDPTFGAWIRDASKNEEKVTQRFVKLWEQISERFKDYSDYLVFEAMNEVGFDDLNKKDAFTLLCRLNQAFVDTVRSSGGNNQKRHLMIAGYWTDIAESCSSNFQMPTDPENRLIVSIHYYTPWQFCTTNIQNTWGTDAEVAEMKRLYGMLKTSFIDKSIPVVIGEYAASGNDMDSCVLFIKTMNEICHSYGIPTFLWDNGGQVNRTTYEWRTPQYLEVLQEAAKEMK